MIKQLKKYHFSLLLVLSMVILLSCKQGSQNKNKETDTVTSGVIQISVDESFQPIMQQEISIFENKYPTAGIVPVYTNEVNAINLLLKDSVRLAITTRKLSEKEKKYLESRKFFAHEVKLATDGIAIIINKKNPASLISISQLQKIMTGEVSSWNQISSSLSKDKVQLVFDNANSSTVRFAIDSICGGKPLSKNLFAQKNNAEVIEYVAKTPNAIGVIGVSWVENKKDSTRLSFSDDVKLMSVSREPQATVENSYKPYQAYIALKQYPLTRDVYVVLTDPRNGLPSGFTTFLMSDIAQRIILKEGIVPATQIVRIVNVREKL
jgi:phosphate transport system substrate-binding protein